MTFQEFLSAIGLSTTSFWGIVLFLTSIGIDIIPKIKWSPWTSLIKWIGARFNSKIDSSVDGLRQEIKELDTKIDNVQSDLNKHITESEIKALQDTRRDILDFANACMNGRKHTKEQFEFVIMQCDDYERYIKDNDIKNGVIEAAIKEIRRLYSKGIREHTFLKEGVEISRD